MKPTCLPQEHLSAALSSRARSSPAPMPAKVELQSAAHIVDLHKEWVSNISFSKDEKLVLSDGGNVILWNFAERKEVRRWKTKSWVYALALSPDGKQAFVSERKPLVFDSGQFKDWICSVSFSADGKWLAGADMAGSVQVWSLA